MSLETRITALAGAVASAINALKASPPAFTGQLAFAFSSTAPSGWIACTGSIGNASSGATTRANADCEALFAVTWEAFADTYAPVSGGRGASAAADFAANKTISLPDARGRILCALDNLGGSAAGIVTVAGSGINGTIPGLLGGDEVHLLTDAESGLRQHSHGYTDRFNSSRSAQGGTNITVASQSTTTTEDVTDLTGGTSADDDHNNMPPVLLLPLFVKL